MIQLILSTGLLAWGIFLSEVSGSAWPLVVTATLAVCYLVVEIIDGD